MVVKYPPSLDLPTDEELKERIESVLRWNSEVDENDISVYVIDGYVSLEGSVHTYWEKVRTEDLVAPIKGVVSVVNKLAVVPSEDISDKIIGEDIMEGLDRNVMVNVEDVNVEVENGIVTLNGQVPSPVAHKAARNTAFRTAGVKAVRDDNLLTS